jgi:hypothetical protein
MKKILFCLLIFFLISCDDSSSKKETEELKKRIESLEQKNLLLEWKTQDLEDKEYCERIFGKNFCKYR